MTTPFNRCVFPAPQAHELGFTLVELLVGMTIGLFLLGGVIALFIGTKQSYSATEAASRLQENGRYAIEVLSREIRKAGFRPIVCFSTNAPTESIKGWNADKDSVRISYMLPDDCTKICQTTYYIADGVTGDPGLRQQTNADCPSPNTNTNQELIEGVCDMQILYGRDENNDGRIDSYSEAKTTWSQSDWNQILALKIDLLLPSTDNNLTDAPMALPFKKNADTSSACNAKAGKDINTFVATDKRLYRMFSTTIALRNRLP